MKLRIGHFQSPLDRLIVSFTSKDPNRCISFLKTQRSKILTFSLAIDTVKIFRLRCVRIDPNGYRSLKKINAFYDPRVVEILNIVYVVFMCLYNMPGALLIENVQLPKSRK